MTPKKRARITNKTTPQASIGGAGAKEQGISGRELLVGGKKVTSLPARCSEVALVLLPGEVQGERRLVSRRDSR